MTHTIPIPLALCLAVFLSLVTGCSADLANPPRLATATAQALATTTATRAPLVLPAPTSTAPSVSGSDASTAPAFPGAPALNVWVNETSPEHRAVVDEIATEFADRYGVNVAVQLVSPALLPELVNTAVLSDTLPDVILHPLEYTAGWVEEGVLDAEAAAEVVEALGEDTFDADALVLAGVGGRPSAVPSDGYHQLLLYRADWFEERGLRPPDSFASLREAAERLYDPEAIISGIVIPTESNLVTTHQAFEQLALANGCRLIDEAGEIVILDEPCREALEQYFVTINRFSPPGVQTDTSARNALLSGQTGIIMTSPAILPDLAGLNPAALPTCPECVDDPNFLADNVGIVTEIRGSGPGATPAAFGNIRNLGITTSANREVAQAFARFWFEEGYERWLAVSPERKVPIRTGTADSPRQFIDAWGLQPLPGSELSLTDIYGEQVVSRLRDDIAAAPRWGIREGQGGLMTRIYDELTLSIVLQEMLSGYFDTDTTLNEAYRRVVDLIPNYAFPFRLDERELEP